MILCFEMNGKKLQPEHGYPLRVIFPGIYGAEHVKWLGKIEAVSEKYRGYYMEKFYTNKIETEKNGKAEVEHVPVHEKNPKSLATRVLKKERNITVFGVAWGGYKSLKRVDVSIDDGLRWNQSELMCDEIDRGWVFWKRRSLRKPFAGRIPAWALLWAFRILAPSWFLNSGIMT